MTEHFILRSSPTSPFARKTRMAIDALGLSDRVTIQTADTMDPADSLLGQNPLGKIPALVREDGSVIYDSGVIIEFLQHVAGSEAMVPNAGEERFRILTLARLADGITEAGLLMVYERRYRDHEHPAVRWVENQRGKILRALAVFAAAPPDAGRIDLVTIGLSCALGYLDFRKQVDWRETYPALAEWLEAFEGVHPVFARTRPPETN